MPIYEYRCSACGTELEKLQKISDPPMVECPECGKPALVKLVSASSFRLKGSGWYETDFKTGNKKNGAAGGDGEPNAGGRKDGDSDKSGSQKPDGNSAGESAKTGEKTASNESGKSSGSEGGTAGSSAKSDSTDSKNPKSSGKTTGSAPGGGSSKRTSD